MKNKTKFLIITISTILSNSLGADEDHNKYCLEWVNADEAAVAEDGIYIDSNKGPMWLKVVEYDRENDRYLVEFPCWH